MQERKAKLNDPREKKRKEDAMNKSYHWERIKTLTKEEIFQDPKLVLTVNHFIGQNAEIVKQNFS